MSVKSSGQSASRHRVLVYGWYGKNNIGDDLFCEAFKCLFPNIDFIFTDNIKLEMLNDISAVFIGGGSFLSQDINTAEECLNIIKTKMIFYVGVGVETEIHPTHKDLMKLAVLIAVRSEDGIDQIRKLNNNIIMIPDLVYSLADNLNYSDKINKSVLILPNLFVIPQHKDPHWKHNSWAHFKFEFSQFLDYLIENKYSINFLSMCKNAELNDDWAAYEIMNCMKNRNTSYILDIDYTDINNIIDLFSKYEVIITQRYHGIILSELARVPYISIHHHDKLKKSYFNDGNFISYYSCSKQTFIDEFNSVEKINKTIAIESNIFDTLKSEINKYLRD